MSKVFGIDRVRIEKRSLNPKEVVVIKLPRPPSINGFQRNASANRRYSTKAYKDWQEEAGARIMQQRPPRFTEPVTVTITLEETNRVSDADNRIKPCLDLLVSHNIIPDDNQKFLRAVTAQWSRDVTGCTVEIRRAA